MSVSALAQTIGLVQVGPSCATTFPSCTISATGTGHLIVVGIQIGGGVSTAITINSVADNAGNVYREAGAARSIDATAGSVVDIWYAQNSNAGATTVTITPSTTVTNGGALIWEFSGANSSAPLDQTAVLNSQASSATPSGAGITTTVANEVVVSLAAVGGNVTGIASGNSFVSDSSLKGNGWAHLITTSAGTFAAQWNESPAGTFASSTATFKAATKLNACDLNSDGLVNVVDVQLATNNYISCTSQPFLTFVSNVITSALTLPSMSCPVNTGMHTASLSWTASTTSGVTYNVYRATASGAYNYAAPLNSIPISGTTFSDCSVTLGQTYFYVVTAVSGSVQSVSSNETSVTIPSS
jgi:hypothetical protein